MRNGQTNRPRSLLKLNRSEAMQQRLLDWFAVHSRDLPWRHHYLPYHVWISEIMLQQTQMSRAVIYFNRWIDRFPDIESVARAHEEEILRLWEGLGYYSRARNLHRAAKLLVREHNGRLPEDHGALLALPGIGKYTAGAIMSLAFNHAYPVVDANVERIFARLFDIPSPVKEKLTHSFIWDKAATLLPKGKARLFNQALMELGALVCMPKGPDCPACPIREDCAAFRLGNVNERPVPGKSKEIIRINMASGVLVHNGLFFIQKRCAGDVWANLWEFPGGRIKEGESPEDALVREFLEETEFAIKDLRKLRIITHSYTRYRVTLHCFSCSLKSNTSTPVLHAAQEFRWAALKDLDHFAFPAPHRTLIRELKEGDK